MEQPHRLVLIDDEPEILEMLDEALSGSFKVTTFPSADHAMEAIKAGKKFDLFMTDIAMPGTSGIEFLGWLRKQKIDSPVIVATGFAEKDNALKAIALGSFAMIEKPFHFGNVFAIVNRASAYLLLQEINEELLQRYSELIDTFAAKKDKLSTDLAGIVEESIAANKLIQRQRDRLSEIYSRLSEV